MGMNPRTLRPGSTFTPRSISGLALWLDAADAQTLYTTDAGPVTAVSSPLDISGCGLWLDASNAGSLTLNGNTVSEWRDLSGNARHFSQATSASQPNANSRTQNGRRVLDFTGAQSLNGNAASLSIAKNVGGLTIFVVGQFDVVASTTMAMLAISRSDVNNSVRAALVYLLGTNQILVGGRRLDADAFASAGYAPNANVNILAGTLDYTNSDAFIWQGGALQASNTSFQTNGSTTNADSLAVVVGNDGSGTQALDGWIGEVVVYPSALSTTDRARAEAYLAAKWGISGVHAQATATSDPVGYWQDKSGNARHATQGTAASRPTISAAAQNGRGNLTFNGTSGYFRCNSGEAFRARIAYAVVRRTGIPPAFAPIYAHRGVNSTVAANSAQEFYVSSRDGTGKLFGIVGAGGVMRVDGAPVTPTNSGVSNLHERDLLPNTTAFRAIAVQGNITDTIGTQIPFVGLDPFGLARTYPMQLCELLVYDSLLDAAKFSALERYLAAKWGVTLAPQVSNADAQDWVNRVYANGGTVSAATATAVNTFCTDIENAGIRDRFYRLNLFCGTSDASLNAVRTPLFRGPSLTGTQYGGTLDTNVNFVQGDYAENAGLTAPLTSTNYLDTGLQTSSLPASVIDSGHLSAWHGPIATSSTDPHLIGMHNSTTDRMRLQLGIRTSITALDSGAWGKATSATSAVAAGARVSGFKLVQRRSSTNLEFWNNSSVDATNTTPTTGIAGTAFSLFVFRLNNGGSAFGDQPGVTLRHYSIGDDMTSSQVTSFYAALSAFNASMGRTS